MSAQRARSTGDHAAGGMFPRQEAEVTEAVGDSPPFAQVVLEEQGRTQVCSGCTRTWCKGLTGASNGHSSPDPLASPQYGWQLTGATPPWARGLGTGCGLRRGRTWDISDAEGRGVGIRGHYHCPAPFPAPTPAPVLRPRPHSFHSPLPLLLGLPHPHSGSLA